MSAPKVFISYSHDSGEHRERVLGLSERLRKDGVETLLDQYVNGAPPEGWPRWMLNQLDAATFVLVVCSETYYRRFRGHEEPNKGKGVDWEGALITQEIYDSRSTTLKFVPVLFTADGDQFIPEPLRAINYYKLTSGSAYDALYDFLLGQAGVEAGQIGELKVKPRAKGAPLTFDDGKSLGTKPRGTPVDISRILKYAPAELIGREHELNLLTAALEGDLVGLAAYPLATIRQRPRVLTFVALGGEGKSSLVSKWAAELSARDGIPCDASFAWTFYSQGSGETQASSSDLFLKEALNFFAELEPEKECRDIKAFAAGPAGAFEKGQRLARLVGQRRSLLILDGLEPLQFSPASPTPGELKDQGVRALLRGLATNSQGLCVVTTRHPVPDLKAFWQTTAPEVPLLRLSTDAGVHLLKTRGVRGTAQEFATLVEDVKGHALTLTLLGGFLKRAFHGDIRQRDRVKFEKADEKMDGGHAFRTMAAYEQWLLSDGGDEGRREVAVLRLMGLFDRPADAGCLAALRRETIPGLTEPLAGLADDDWEYCLSGLEAAKLLTVNRDAAGALDSLDAHPHLREYFARQLRTQQPDAWRAAHRRLYEHLCASTQEGGQPTLEALQPLYQAVAHGCQAGLQQDVLYKVYHALILRKDEQYSFHKLGVFRSDLGAIACFFEQPWTRVSPALKDNEDAWLTNQAAYCLRALGRLVEAVEPMKAGVPVWVRIQNWKQAAIRASNLSELELTLGEVAGAVGDAEQSVTYADRSGDADMRMTTRTTHADALHQAGRRAEAEARFREAEQMQAESQPAYPLLYSQQGFIYCDLLLAEAERAAWRMSHTKAPRHQEADLRSFVPSCEITEALRAVSERAAQTLKWMQAYSGATLLDIALDHLTLGRAALYVAILDSPDSALRIAHSELASAVSGLRRAGDATYIPHALLTRAWQRSLTDALTSAQAGPDSAQSDLDEAWEIAERGPMPLFLADIHLYRARLFFREAEYPWESPRKDLEEAEKIIRHETTHTKPDGEVIRARYARREVELADAKAAILG